MKKTFTLVATLMFAMMTLACGGAESEETDMTLRVFAPIATEAGTTTRVEAQNAMTGEFELIKEISVLEIDEVEVDQEAIRGVMVELAGSAGNPVFSTIVYFDGAVAAAPVDLRVKVSQDEEMKVRMQLVVETEEKFYPEVYEEILTAERVEVQMVPIQTVR